MHDIIVNNIQPILWIITLLEIIFIALFAKKHIETQKPIVACMLLISIGLFVDAFLIAVGGVVGAIPEWIARIRFICHGGLIPLMFPICGYGLKISQKAMKILWIFTAAVMVIGIFNAFFLEFNVVNIGASVRQATSSMTPVWTKKVSTALSIVPVIPLILSGAVVFARFRIPYLFLAGVFMFAFAAICPATGNMDIMFVVSMFGELFMAMFYYLYVVADEKKALQEAA